ncbi:MAG TPA: hypothetical protein DD670_04220 [Planctomycetaceae bacterium]|nr:hypothetical protein [Planctomycetaceae bacterium]
MAKIRAAGDPVSLADLEPEPIPPEQNAATYLRRARDDLRAIEQEIVKAERADSDSDRQSPAVLEAMRSALAAYPEVVPLLEQAAECPEYGISEPLDPGGADDPQVALETVMSRAGDNRSVARLLGSYRCRLLLADGKHDEAARSAVSLLKLTRHFDREPCMVSFLVAIACRGHAMESLNEVLQAGAISDEVSRELEDELAKHDINEAYRQALRTERPFGFAFFRTMPGENTWFARAYYNRAKLNYLGLLEWYLVDSKAADSSEARAMVEAPEPTDIWGVLLNPAIEATRLAARRGQSLLNVIRVLNALQRRENPDEPPAADLSDLGLPREATLDPFTGKPVIVKRVPDGWLVYSVGQNGIDDGGEFGDNRSDEGYGPPAKPEDKKPEDAGSGQEDGGDPVSAE